MNLKVLPSREEVLPFVERWVELLAQDRYEEAVELVEHPLGVNLTADMLRQVVANYGTLEPRRDGKVFRVTSLSTAVQGEGPNTQQRDVDWFDTENGFRVGHVHFDVPLNGEHSDLTATFWVNERENGFVLELEDLHVL